MTREFVSNPFACLCLGARRAYRAASHIGQCAEKILGLGSTEATGFRGPLQCFVSLVESVQEVTPQVWRSGLVCCA